MFREDRTTSRIRPSRVHYEGDLRQHPATLPSTQHSSFTVLYPQRLRFHPHFGKCCHADPQHSVPLPPRFRLGLIRIRSRARLHWLVLLFLGSTAVNYTDINFLNLGTWELAHECGHGALSKSKAFNYGAGLIMHSVLLVPFHSWRITHATHHKTTNNLDKDIAFVPDIKDAYQAARESHSKVWTYIEDMPIVTLVHLFFHQIIAWPLYLTINNFALERMARSPWWKRSHFYIGGDGPNFKPEHARDVLISDIGIGAAMFALWGAVQYFGAWNVMLFYGFPWMWTNHWIRE